MVVEQGHRGTSHHTPVHPGLRQTAASSRLGAQPLALSL